MSGEYDDIDFSDHSFNASVPDDVAPDMPKKIEYVTADYDSTEFEIVSPEEAQMEHIREMKNQRFANSDFGSAVNNIEQRLGREITVDEFDKLNKLKAIIPLDASIISLAKRSSIVFSFLNLEYCVNHLKHKVIFLSALTSTGTW